MNKSNSPVGLQVSFNLMDTFTGNFFCTDKDDFDAIRAMLDSMEVKVINMKEGSRESLLKLLSEGDEND